MNFWTKRIIYLLIASWLAVGATLHAQDVGDSDTVTVVNDVADDELPEPPSQPIILGDEYKDKSIVELVELYKESCERGIRDNCYQLALLYKQKKVKDKIFNLNEVGLKAEEKKAREDDYKAVLAKLTEIVCAADKNDLLCLDLNGKKETTGSTILYWGGILLIGLAAMMISLQIFQDEDSFRAQEQLEDQEQAVGKKGVVPNHGVVIKYSRPFFKRYVTPIVQGMKSKKNIKEKYKRKLAASGLTDYMSAEDFFAFKLFLILGFPVVFFALRTFLEETWPLQLIPVVAALGFFYPDIWIKGKIQQRQKDIVSAMPFAVDMLALSVEAGLDFMAAMTKVIEKAKATPLTEEFEILIKETKLGASRAEALRNMAWRIDLIQISSFCATLIAADSVGASIGPILKALSGEIRQKRSSDVEKAGATAATKILFPMLFLIVPAVLIVVAGPLIMGFIGAKK